MQYRPLGRTGLSVSAIGLGTMTWGQQNTEEEGHAQMDYAVERGVNFFDTAEMYSIPPQPATQGSTERIIGTWFKKTGKRKDIILASKIAGRGPMTWLRPDGAAPRHTPAQINQAIEASLARLQTDYIDLYQLHWPDRKLQVFGGHTYRDYDDDYVAFDDIVDALQRHVEKGTVRAFGVSNETAWGVMKFIEASRRGGPRVASIQNAYNLVNRTFETGLAEVAMREAVGLLAYSPLAQGYLTGKYLNGARPDKARSTLFNRGQRYETPGAEAALRRYVELAASLEVSPAALAIKFCDTRPFTTSTLIGATTLEQLAHDMDAFDLPWTPEMERGVNDLHAAHSNPCP